MSEFLAMGGYARYVWPSIALGLTVVVLNIVWARSLYGKAREQARRRIAMQGEDR